MPQWPYGDGSPTPAEIEAGRRTAMAIPSDAPREVTILTPKEEQQFQAWIAAHRDAPGIAFFDEPDAFYDMRGFWKDKAARARWKPGDHFPDTYKQHGHPTFSIESKYARGPQDAGHWEGDVFVPPTLTGRSLTYLGGAVPLPSLGGLAKLGAVR